MPMLLLYQGAWGHRDILIRKGARLPKIEERTVSYWSQSPGTLVKSDSYKNFTNFIIN